jgi:hypothetical protein
MTTSDGRGERGFRGIDADLAVLRDGGYGSETVAEISLACGFLCESAKVTWRPLLRIAKVLQMIAFADDWQQSA